MANRFLPSLRGLFGKSADGADTETKTVGDYYGDVVSSGLWQPARARPWPVERAVAEGYERIIWVFKAVEAISANAARLPYRVKDGEEVLDDHPLYKVLNGRANPIETGREFRKRLMSQILLSKRGAFVEITTSNGGDIVRMDLLPPGRTRPVPGDNGVLIDHFQLARADGSFRDIPPEKVRWFREPHPLDPFSGTTPLEAAGMSAELDYFGRLYNVSFLKNDGRPGGVLAINGEMDPREMDRIEQRFKKGPTEAGNLSVINGDVSYVDLAARPRDVQYETLSKIAKNEVLCAFGTPESVLGYAADRSYSNAEQEELNFWRVTMPTWLDLVATTLDGDSDDKLQGYFDTSKIEVLQRAEANRREEARKEFDLGLISANEYRERAGYEDIDRPKARALWVASGKTVVPATDADAKAIDKEEMDKLPPEFIANARNPAAATNNGLGKAPAAGAARGGAQPVAPLRPVPNAPRPTRQVNQPRGASGVAGGRAVAAKTHPAGASFARSGAEPVMRLERPRQRKKAALTAAGGPSGESDADDAAHADLEEVLAAALTAVGDRLLQRTLARLNSPKARKGTRHWQPDAALPSDNRTGVKALDAGRAVDEDRWGEEAEQAARPLLEDAANTASAALLTDVAAHTAAGEAARRVPEAVTQVLQMVGGAARRTAAKLTALIDGADRAGASLPRIEELLSGAADRIHSAMAGIARQAATGMLSGAREAAAHAVADTTPGAAVDRMWRTRRDDKVRDTHKAAHGQHQPVGAPFVVGGALLRFPGDPFGPPGEVYECRCRLNYRVRHTGRFTVAPPGEYAPA